MTDTVIIGHSAVPAWHIETIEGSGVAFCGAVMGPTSVPVPSCEVPDDLCCPECLELAAMPLPNRSALLDRLDGGEYAAGDERPPLHLPAADRPAASPPWVDRSDVGPPVRPPFLKPRPYTVARGFGWAIVAALFACACAAFYLTGGAS